jgi:hypothetical protein
MAAPVKRSRAQDGETDGGPLITLHIGNNYRTVHAINTSRAWSFYSKLMFLSVAADCNGPSESWEGVDGKAEEALVPIMIREARGASTSSPDWR